MNTCPNPQITSDTMHAQPFGFAQGEPASAAQPFAARDAFRYRKVREIIARSWTGKAIDARICFSVDRATGAQSWLHRRTLVIGYRGMAQTRILLTTCKAKASAEALDQDNSLTTTTTPTLHP
jgi:hypothetical protein